jgi:DNA-directed RNA polymerase subunit beta'
MIVKKTGMAKTAKFLDDIKEIGFRTAFKGGLSFNLGDIQTPAEKIKIIEEAQVQVDEVIANYNMGFITNNERALEELFGDEENNRKAVACLNVMATRIASVFASLRVCNQCSLTLAGI